MADGKVFTGKTRQGGGTGGVDRHPRRLRAAQRRVEPGRTEEIRDLAALAAVYAPQARGPGTRAPTAPLGGSTTPGALASACRR